MMGDAPPADRKDAEMDQLTFAEQEHDLKKRRTRRELFLEKMDQLIP